MEEVEIHAAGMGDLEDIQRLNRKLCEKEREEFDSTIAEDFPFTEEGEKYFEERVKGEDGCALVAILDGKTVGYLVGEICEEEFYRNVSKLAEAENMFILEEYRGQGIGKRLLEEFIDWCDTKDVERIRAVASSQNKQAIQFYRKMDFEDYSLVLEKDL